MRHVIYGVTEQSRLTGSYASDACDAQPLQQLKTTSCDDADDSAVRNSALHIPVIVPCSFVPVSPRFLDGNTHHHRHHIIYNFIRHQMIEKKKQS